MNRVTKTKRWDPNLNWNIKEEADFILSGKRDDNIDITVANIFSGEGRLDVLKYILSTDRMKYLFENIETHKGERESDWNGLVRGAAHSGSIDILDYLYQNKYANFKDPYIRSIALRDKQFHVIDWLNQKEFMYKRIYQHNNL